MGSARVEDMARVKERVKERDKQRSRILLARAKARDPMPIEKRREKV